MKKRIWMKAMSLMMIMAMLFGNIAALAESTESGNAPAGMGEPPAGDRGQPPEGGPGGNPPEGMGEPPQGGPGGPGEMGQPPEGGMSGPGGEGVSTEGQLGSWSGGGMEDYDYDAALYVTAEGIDEEKSSLDRLSAGEATDSAAEGIVIEDSASHHEGILVEDADYAITDAAITMNTDADGTDTCDFSGVGSAVAVYGDSNVTIEDTTIETSGVATMPLFVDDGATVTVSNSTLISHGGTLSADYLNTPDQALMVAPPWILGIMGTSRCTNLMGTDSTLNVLDSDTFAGAWAVLSTDAGSNMALNIVNTSLTLLNADESAAAQLQEAGGQICETLDNPYTTRYGSGYGTYAIGNSHNLFAGAEVNVGTYGAILTGGSVTCVSLTEGETIELPQADGTTLSYTAEADKATVITSDTFGFMAHQGENTLALKAGTVVDSGYATFLVKTGSSNETLTANIDGAEITNGGVLIQVMDNDDATNGGMMSTDDAANTNGGSQNFISTHTENADFNTASATAGGETQTFTFTNGDYSGNIYNASGSDNSAVTGALNASALNVTFGEGATYIGAIASTAAIHVTYEGSEAVKANGGYAFDDADEAAAFAETYQNTSFDITHYFDIGQVANLVNDNGGNVISVTLTSDAVWNVTGTSLISALAIEDDAQVIVPEGVTLTVNGVDYSNVVLMAGDL